MSNLHAEEQLLAANAELNRRIVLLEKNLRGHAGTVKTLQDSEKRYRRLFESAQDGILILDADTGRVVDANPFLLHLLGYSYEDLCGQHIWEIGVFKDIAASKDAFKTLQDNEYIRYEDLPLETRAGQPIAVEFVSNVYLVDNSKVIQCNIRDITANKRAKAERKRLMSAIEQVGEAVVMTDAQGNIQYVNPSFERMTGYSCREAVGQNPRILKSGKQDEPFYRTLWETISGGKTWTGRMVNRRKDGTLYTEDTTISPVRDVSEQIVNYVAVKRDISEHLKLTAQFHQAQKLESIGLLAGGVAHDYNNMLTVILCYAELALRNADPAEALHSDLEEIIHAAQRSVEITRQLLAFARKQSIIPVVLDLNQVVENTLRMLRRLIGENITLEWLPEAGRCPVYMDPVQIDQILANLCINARDAISNIGRITIETGNTVFDEAYCADHEGTEPGDFVLLAVSDNGCGMDSETIVQIFEPFFTSKEVGQGSGLGLSTVYGIVRQNNGFINVYSEPGNGTTFRIHLPRSTGQAVDALQEAVVENPRGNGETVLVVEDEPALLKMDKRMLEELGYRVLTAGTPGEAIRLAGEHAEEIHLIVTDIVMPEMNGWDLAEQMHSVYPGIRILFMSGFTASMIANRGVPGIEEAFIQKPFTMTVLALKVRDALGPA